MGNREIRWLSPLLVVGLCAGTLHCSSDNNQPVGEVISDDGDDTDRGTEPSQDGGLPDLRCPDHDAGTVEDAQDTTHDRELTGDDAPPDSGADTGEPPLALTNFLTIENPANVLSFFIEWRTDRPATTQLYADCGDLFELSVGECDGVYETDHAVFLMGLAEGATCELLARSVAEDGAVAETTGTITVGALPDGLPTLWADTYLPDDREPGWSLFGTSSREFANSSPVFTAVTDEQGRYRWYHQRAQLGPGQGPWDISLYEGNILCAGRGSVPAIVLSWTGEIVFEFQFDMHHDIQPSPFTDNALLYLGYSNLGCPDDTTEGKIVEWSWETEGSIWNWRICDHYEPPVVSPDWSHLNDIEPVPGEQAVLISSRHQSAVFKVNRDTDALEWVLGGADSDFAMSDEDIFLQQHALRIQPSGTLLMFDNGLDGVREYSRAIELALSFDGDGSPQSAEIVWDYTNLELYAGARSEADRLANGNTQLTYSLDEWTEESIILEVTSDGRQGWELRTPPGWNLYRAERIEPPALGFILRENDDTSP